MEVCQYCQARQQDVQPVPDVLTLLAQCAELNQRVHMNLFGPLKVSNQDKKLVLCLTDAFTKYVVRVAIDNKEASTVANPIFKQWICKFGTPLEFVSDNSREFCNNLAKKIVCYTTDQAFNNHPLLATVKQLGRGCKQNNTKIPIIVHRLFYIGLAPLHGTNGVCIQHKCPQIYQDNAILSNPWVGCTVPIVPKSTKRQIAEWHSMDITGQAEQQYNKTEQVHNFHQEQMVWLNKTNYLDRN
jgi:hypothetical protein